MLESPVIPENIYIEIYEFISADPGEK